MDIKDSPYIDTLMDRIDNLPVEIPSEMARVLPLYIKVANDDGILKNVSVPYIDSYDGKKFYKKFTKHIDQIYAVFNRNGFVAKEIRDIFKRVAKRVTKIPTNLRGMESLKGVVFEEMHAWMKRKRLFEARGKIVSMFKSAVKHYLNMTYELGFNEPSACAKFLAENHKIDKYIMAGDFAVLLLPFLPEVEETIRKSYEHYEMQDAWENLKGRYFNHKAEYANLATEIKSTFKKTIVNFSRYFDDLYTNTYYKIMLSRRGRNK